MLVKGQKKIENVSRFTIYIKIYDWNISSSRCKISATII